MNVRSCLIGLAALGAMVVASGSLMEAHAQNTGAAPSASISAGESTSGDYILGRDDVIEVTLLGRTDFGGRGRVQADGTIQLPLVGKIAAADHTASELSNDVRSALQKGGYFSDPIVSVEVVSYASRYVTVLGAVGSPGLVPINRPYRISEILARVGGVKENAADYLIVRSEKGAERRLLIRDLATGDSTQDPYVAPGDKIYSPPADLFYIYGQVNTPGGFALTDGMTVRMAIARGGGLTESGSDKSVQVNRGGKKTKLQPGDKLLPGDVLFVAERMF
jgi:polysaccharide export outer membrane protein